MQTVSVQWLSGLWKFELISILFRLLQSFLLNSRTATNGVLFFTKTKTLERHAQQHTFRWFLSVCVVDEMPGFSFDMDVYPVYPNESLPNAYPVRQTMLIKYKIYPNLKLQNVRKKLLQDYEIYIFIFALNKTRIEHSHPGLGNHARRSLLKDVNHRGLGIRKAFTVDLLHVLHKELEAMFLFPVFGIVGWFPIAYAKAGEVSCCPMIGTQISTGSDADPGTTLTVAKNKAYPGFGTFAANKNLRP